MLRRITLVISLVFFILAGNLCPTINALAAVIEAPAIVNVIGQEADNLALPNIIGLTPKDTEVLVYIDGKYTGLAKVNSEGTLTDNFYYKHSFLLPEGRHIVSVVARDKTSLLLSPSSTEFDFFVVSLPAPTLMEPDEKTVTGKVKPLIKGVTVSKTFARIWIDGTYNGKTKILEHESGTANFAYEPFLNLSVGSHTAWAIVEDELGRQSQQSDILRFKIEESMPAPTLFAPAVNSQTTADRPFIVGVAKNDSLIKVYIDHVFYGQFKVKNHESGTANFAYLPYVALKAGNHLVYTEAVDFRGKVSQWSNIIYFTVKPITQPAISETAAEERAGTVTRIREGERDKEEPAVKISPQEGTVEDVEVLGEEGEAELGKQPAVTEKEEIDQLIEKVGQEEEKSTGLLDESKQKQGRLQLNLIIFIIFLLTVIIWIFWVNRELIKERRALTDLEKDRDKDKPESVEPDSPKEPPASQPPIL